MGSRSFNRNQPFSEDAQETLALPLYSRYWDVAEEEITEVDKEGTNGNQLAKLLDKGGVDKIVQLRGNLYLAQRLRRGHYASVDFTIRRQAEHDWDAEYAKLKDAHEGNGDAPSKYAYGQVNRPETGFQIFYILDFGRFRQLEFAGKLSKLESPADHDETEDPYYFENKDEHDNGFYAWEWEHLHENDIIEAVLVGNDLIPIQNIDESRLFNDGYPEEAEPPQIGFGCDICGNWATDGSYTTQRNKKYHQYLVCSHCAEGSI